MIDKLHLRRSKNGDAETLRCVKQSFTIVRIFRIGKLKARSGGWKLQLSAFEVLMSWIRTVLQQVARNETLWLQMLKDRNETSHTAVTR